MSMAETAPLKRYLNEVATRQANTYRHSWQEGDLVMIDLAITMHYVFPDYDTTTNTRVMQRITLTNDAEAGAPEPMRRPLGVTGENGEEMARRAGTMENPGDFLPIKTYLENTTML